MTAGQSTFGAVLRQYRLAGGLTQERLAERAGLSPRTIAYLERQGTPRPETFLLLARALGLSPQEQNLFLAAARGPDRGLPSVPLPAYPAPAVPGLPLLPLIGRREILDRLDAHLRGQGPPLFLLVGEPGIGKTRLLREVANRAVAAGWTVLPGGCHRHGGQEPYTPLLEALQRHLAGQDLQTLHHTLDGCAWLVQLLPELAGGPIPPLPAQALPPDQQRRLMVGAVQHYLGNIAGPAGTLLVLDDLQWAGRDALDLLATLLHSDQTIPLRIVGACRDTEVPSDHPLATLLADHAPANLARQEPLGPLSRPEAAQLLAMLLGGDEVEISLQERVLGRAGGMPFFLVSWAQAIRAGQGELDELPWDLRQCIRQRVAALSAEGQAVLGIAAVIGRVVGLPLLLSTADLPEMALVEALETACQARLLEEVGRKYRFVHDVIREVVEADLGLARRAALHRRVAEALEGAGHGAPAELLAYHYAFSTAPDKALDYLERAGDQAAAQHAHGAAETHYGDLLDRLEERGSAHDAARVRGKLGEVLFRSGQYGAALLLFEGAAEALRAVGDLEGLARVTLLIGHVHRRRGTPDEGAARIQTLLEVLDGGDSSPSLATVYALLGHLLQTAGDYQEALTASERAIELARASRDDQTRVLAEWNRACCLAALGHAGTSQRLLQEVLPLMEAVGDLDMLSRAHHNLAYTYAAQGAFEAARTHLDRACEIAKQLGDSGDLALTLALRGRLACLCGHWEQARLDLAQAVEVSGRLDESRYSIYPLYFLADLRLAQGAGTDAARAAGDAIAQAEQNTDLQALCWASNVMARYEILDGRPEAACSRLVRLLDRTGVAEDDATGLLAVLAWAQLKQNQVDGASDSVEQAITRARRNNLQLVLVEALWVRGMVMLQKRCWPEAAGSIEEGLTLARGMPYPYAEARLLQLDGERLAAQGEPAGARERLEKALIIFERLGARRESEWAEGTLAALSQNTPVVLSHYWPVAPSHYSPAGASQKLSSGAPQLTDAQWARIAALLPPRRRSRGRPRADDRQTLEAILYVQRTGCAWSDIPPELADKATAHRRWREWQAAGLWEQIVALAQTPSG